MNYKNYNIKNIKYITKNKFIFKKFNIKILSKS